MINPTLSTASNVYTDCRLIKFIIEVVRYLQFERTNLRYTHYKCIPTEGIVGRDFEHGAVAFFDLQPGLKLAIWSRKDLSHETKVPLSPPSSTEMTIGHNVGSKEEVDAIMSLAERAGAIITDPAHDAFWGGYSGHFLDHDGHLWEVVWNPAWAIEE